VAISLEIDLCAKENDQSLIAKFVDSCVSREQRGWQRLGQMATLISSPSGSCSTAMTSYLGVTETSARYQTQMTVEGLAAEWADSDMVVIHLKPKSVIRVW
jgi:hypothetical protein